MDSATSLGKSSESKRRACSCGVPDISTSCDHTSAEARSASAPPESVDNKMSLLTQCGCSNASICAMNPPIDQDCSRWLTEHGRRQEITSRASKSILCEQQARWLQQYAARGRCRR